jgi:hypothetical protein
MKDNPLLQGEIIAKDLKYTEHFKKIFFFRNSKPILIKLDKKHPWVKEFEIVQIKDQVLRKGEIIF